MLIALAGLMMFAPLQAAPSIGSIESLAPSAVGEVVLRGRDHGVVESVTPDLGLDPPGVVKIKLMERPSSISGGCQRRQWTATFQHNPTTAQRTAVLLDAYASTELSLPTGRDCSTGEFAHVNSGMTIAEALSALRHLRQVRSGKAKVRFSCSDSTGSSLCRTSDMIRRELARLPAWAVTRKSGIVEFWLGERGQAVTAVSYHVAASKRVRVERRVPASF